MRHLVRFAACLGLFSLPFVAQGVEDDIVIKKKPTAGAASDLDSLPGRRYGLLVGVNDYTYFSDLTFCNADISNLSQALQQSGFDARDLTVLRDGSTDRHLLPFRNNILTQLKNLLESVRPNDLVIVAFSGHGVHLDGKSYLCPTDAQLDRAGETMLSLDQVYEMLQECAASQKLLIVDACRNDPTPSGTRSPAGIEQTNDFTRSLQQSQPPRGTMLFNSCAPNQYSVEDPDFKSGVFMHYVIDGLRGEADADKDSKVSLFELYRYAEYETKTHVRRTRNLVQTPVLKGEVTGVYELAVVSEKSLEQVKADLKPAAEVEKTEVATADGAKAAKIEATVVDEAAHTKALISENALLKQGNQYFTAGKYEDAINTFSNVIKVEDNKAVVREAFKRRSAAYLAADPSGNVLKALADSQAAGRESLTVQVRSDAKVMDEKTVVAQLRSGQLVEIASVNDIWLQVVAVDGNDSISGWLDMKHLAQPKPQVVVVPMQHDHHNHPQPPQYPPYPPRPRPYPNPNTNPNGNRDAVIREIEKQILRSIFD